ncbi:transposase [Micromonospora sp. 4G55]|nr:transposase [Micromonospora sp. 4G55]
MITGVVHHVGSTAVPRPAAKPVIDIIVGVADIVSSRPCIELLKPLLYWYWPYRAEVMHWFCKPHPSQRAHHLHLVPTGSPRYLRVISGSTARRTDRRNSMSVRRRRNRTCRGRRRPCRQWTWREASYIANGRRCGGPLSLRCTGRSTAGPCSPPRGCSMGRAGHQEIKDADFDLRLMIGETAPELLEQPGVGTEVAAQLLVTAGDNPERIRSERSFAALCGVSPISASSGRTDRHRLNRGGDRGANLALHMIALNRLRTDERTRAYAERRRAQGLNHLEIMRCLKRYIAREMFALVRAALKVRNSVPPPLIDDLTLAA